MLNKVILIGRLGAAPELLTTRSGVPMLKFRIATNESYINKLTGQKEEKTQWHQIVTYGPFAETMSRCLAKGMQVYVEGKIENNRVLKEDGTYAYFTDINAKTIRRLGNIQQTSYDSASATSSDPIQPSEYEEEPTDY